MDRDSIVFIISMLRFFIGPESTYHVVSSVLQISIWQGTFRCDNRDMTKNLETGMAGEALAADYLQRRGYDILERNWRSGKKEIDIIAMFEDLLVFVEVKTRSNRGYGGPGAALNAGKWKNIAIAAGAYMRQNGYEWEVRFDIIAVRFQGRGKAVVRHFRDMYFPGRD